MTFVPRDFWDQLTNDLRRLDDADCGGLTRLCVAIQAVLAPEENLEPCYRQLQFLTFEVQRAGAGEDEVARWQRLREFVFEQRKFSVTAARVGVLADDVLMPNVIARRAGHPLALCFLVMTLAEALDLPLTVLQAKHHYLLKWVRPGKTAYLDVFKACRALSDEELVAVVNRTSSNLESYGAKRLLTRYLDLLARAFQAEDKLAQLHKVYDLMLFVDDMNITALGRRALLRSRLGMERESRLDLKRYFTFVETSEAPPELREAWQATQDAPDGKPPRPSDVLH